MSRAVCLWRHRRRRGNLAPDRTLCLLLALWSLAEVMHLTKEEFGTVRRKQLFCKEELEAGSDTD